ncbi:GRF zinc finger protein [Tanacetum coccineum]|uniref:GRF zinc finger protein n=1 Tax=Tanacetum coccineum TaxID=301880 RepID=A0ABQ5IVF5_9ASTR
MSSSSHSSNWVNWKRRNAGWEIDNLCNRVQVWCECGDLCGKWTSWTQTNPGRRFLGCPNYKAAKKCDFFHWWDEDVSVECYKARVLELEKKMNQEHIDFENKKLKMKEKMKTLKYVKTVKMFAVRIVTFRVMNES